MLSQAAAPTLKLSCLAAMSSSLSFRMMSFSLWLAKMNDTYRSTVENGTEHGSSA